MAAELPINIKDLDQRVVREYLKHSDLITALDEYILFADRQLIPKLVSLVHVQKTVQPGLKVDKLYRGFGNWGPQEDLGAKSMAVGDSGTFRSTDKVVSTSTSLEIAKAFGPSVVEITNVAPFTGLIVTDELSFIVSRRRNLDKPMTQKEVILLPPIGFEFTVLEQKKKGLFW